MDREILINVENVSKKFSHSLKHVMLYGAADITRDFFGIPTDGSNLRNGEFWAVDNVSFQLKRGQSIGLIGANGSGKSTLLKMINGIYSPDCGRISVNGQVGALIEVGAGFHPLLTGRENIYVNGSILGMTKSEISARFDDIVNFADIGTFIDTPVKHYSSGMYVRLGFSVAIHCNPDILLVDEVLAVGDYTFQVKCLEKIREMLNNGVSVIIVSHSDDNIKSICDSGLCLNNGKQIFFGDVDRALTNYRAILNSKGKDYPVENWEARRGDGSVRFKEIKVLDVNGNVVESVPYGTDKVIIHASYKCKKRILNPRFFVALKDAYKKHVVVLSATSTSKKKIAYIEGEGEIKFILDIGNLGVNLYGVYAGISDSKMFNVCYDIFDCNGLFLEIVSTQEVLLDERWMGRPYVMNDYLFEHITK